MTKFSPAKNGSKPAVAFINQEAAVKNISVKIHALALLKSRVAPIGPRGVSREVDVKMLLDSLPTTRTKFNAWTYDHVPVVFRLPLEEFGTNANDTLRKDFELLSKVESLVKTLREIAKNWSGNIEPTRIASLKKKLQISEQLLSIAEQELRSSYASNEELRKNNIILKEKLSILERESKEALLARDLIISKIQETHLVRNIGACNGH